MKSARRDLPAFQRRLEVVMQVQLGLLTVREAAKALGISPKHFYRMEAKVMAAALSAATPAKRGRKAKRPDPKIAELQERLRIAEREKELLEIRAKDLEEVNAEMKSRVLGQGPGEKNRRRRSTVSPGVQADGAAAGGGERTSGDSTLP